METVTSIAATAAKAVWGPGDQHKEPVSGASGDVSKGEPYDAGNLDPAQQQKVASDMELADPAKTDASKTAPNDDKPTTDSKEPSQAQTDARDPADDPDTIPADDLKGPGPRPLEQVAKEHAGNAAAGPDPTTEKTGIGSTHDEANEHKASSKAAGQEYVKASGLAADGGDFDATKPGAGKEADRLLDQKGIEHGPAAAAATSSTPSKVPSESPSTPSSSSKKNRQSLGARIKAKLHRNSSKEE